MDCALSEEQVGTGEEVLVCHKLAMECKCFASTYCNISVETSCEEEEVLLNPGKSPAEKLYMSKCSV